MCAHRCREVLPDVPSTATAVACTRTGCRRGRRRAAARWARGPLRAASPRATVPPRAEHSSKWVVAQTPIEVEPALFGRKADLRERNKANLSVETKCALYTRSLRTTF